MEYYCSFVWTVWGLLLWIQSRGFVSATFFFLFISRGFFRNFWENNNLLISECNPPLLLHRQINGASLKGTLPANFNQLSEMTYMYWSFHFFSFFSHFFHFSFTFSFHFSFNFSFIFFFFFLIFFSFSPSFFLLEHWRLTSCMARCLPSGLLYRF